MTRRFGIGGAIAYIGFLTFGVVSEQIKTRLEVAAEERDTRDVVNGAEVILPSGVRYSDQRVGGGTSPAPGLLVVLNFVGKANGQVFEDTFTRGKPIVFRFGGRPYTGGVCAGLEEALRSMKAGGKRRVFVPPELGFPTGFVLRPTRHVDEKEGVIPPNAMLEYEVTLERVSVPPS